MLGWENNQKNNKEHYNLSGIYNISIPISKFELLTKLSNVFDLNVDINETKILSLIKF